MKKCCLIVCIIFRQIIIGFRLIIDIQFIHIDISFFRFPIKKIDSNIVRRNQWSGGKVFGELTTRRRISLQCRKIKRQHDYSRVQTVNFDDGRILFVQPDIQASANLALLRRSRRNVLPKSNLLVFRSLHNSATNRAISSLERKFYTRASQL